MGGVARQQHPAMAEARRHPLMGDVEIAVHDRVGEGGGEELLQPRLHAGFAQHLLVALRRRRSGTRCATGPGGPSAETLKQLHQAPGSAK